MEGRAYMLPTEKPMTKKRVALSSRETITLVLGDAGGGEPLRRACGWMSGV